MVLPIVTTIKMSEKSEKKKSFAEQYPPLDEKGIREQEELMDKAKQKYASEAQEVSDALTDYLNIKDPMVLKGKAIAWVRRPSMKQLKELIPLEMRKYVNKDPDEIPKTINKKYEKFFYEKMAEMIVIPKYTPKEWEAKANPWLIRRFWLHISEIARLMEGHIENF